MIRSLAVLAFLAIAPPGVAEARWQSSAVLAGPVLAALDPQVGMDAAGNATVVYGAAVGPSPSTEEHPPPGPQDQLFARPWNADGSMGDPVELGANIELESPAVAVDPRGDAIAAWAMWNGQGDVIEIATRPAGGSFGLAQTISETNAGHPSIAINATGGYVVAWDRPSGSGSTELEEATVGNVRSAPPTQATLVAKAGFGTDPRVAIDRNGDIVVAWTASRERLFVSSRPAGGRFAAARAISQSGVGTLGSHSLQMNPRGDVAAVWERIDDKGPAGNSRYRMEVAAWRFGGRLPTSRGRPITPTGDSTFGSDDPALAIDSRGNLLALWTHEDRHFKAHLETWRHRAGRGFPRSGTRRDAFQDFGGQVVAMDAQGNAYMAWLRYEGPNAAADSDALMGAAWPAGSSFLSPQLLQSPGAPGGPLIAAAVAAAGNGQAALVWDVTAPDVSMSVMGSRYGK
ncbi:MAG: hypothetical protein JWM71_1624 [Solirubrobacteraceae bacterium]|nr:hypothetical protein [Solirubrobacteraceae bacterium]